MKLFPTGKDANFFKQLVIVGLVIGVYKVLDESYPTLSTILLIVGSLVLLVRYLTKKKKGDLGKDTKPLER